MSLCVYLLMCVLYVHASVHARRDGQEEGETEASQFTQYSNSNILTFQNFLLYHLYF